MDYKQIEGEYSLNTEEHRVVVGNKVIGTSYSLASARKFVQMYKEAQCLLAIAKKQ